MSRQLVESIVAGNMLEASDVVSAKLNEIRACKMYEMKKMYQAEAFGGLTKAEIEARKKAGYVKASEILGDPRERREKDTAERLNPKAKIIKKKIAEENIEEIRLSGDIAGSAGRKIAAAGLKLGRKFLGRDFSKRYMKARSSQMPNVFKSSGDDWKDNTKAAGAEPSVSKPSEPSSDYQRPGRLQRNINTFMGHEPGHVDTRTPEEKLKSKGGRLGKVARSLTTDLARIGFGNLE